MERLVSSQEIYKGKIVNLSVDEVKLDNGRKTTREVVKHRGACVILPILRKGEVVLIEQFRYAVGRELVEAPAGTREENEDAIETAYRELIEETGYSSNQIEHIIDFYSTPGYTTEILSLFFAHNLKKVGSRPETDEDIRIRILPLTETLKMIEIGEIIDAKTIIALLMYHKEINNK